MGLPDRFPAVHDRVLSAYELALLHGRRDALLAHARGTVLELGGGTGSHLACYRGGAVDRVVVLGPDELTRRTVTRRAGEVHVPVEVVDDLSVAGLGPGTVDTVVSQFVLCAVPDPLAALEALGVLLAPEGSLVFLEHVPVSGLSVAARRATRPVFRAISPGCHQSRDIPAIIREAGFTITDLERFTVPTLALPLRSCAAGVARRRLEWSTQ